MVRYHSGELCDKVQLLLAAACRSAEFSKKLEEKGLKWRGKPFDWMLLSLGSSTRHSHSLFTQVTPSECVRLLSRAYIYGLRSFGNKRRKWVTGQNAHNTPPPPNGACLFSRPRNHKLTPHKNGPKGKQKAKKM